MHSDQGNHNLAISLSINNPLRASLSTTTLIGCTPWIHDAACYLHTCSPAASPAPSLCARLLEEDQWKRRTGVSRCAEGFLISPSLASFISLCHIQLWLCRRLIVIPRGCLSSKLICSRAGALTLIVQILQEEAPAARSVSGAISLS